MNNFILKALISEINCLDLSDFTIRHTPKDIRKLLMFFTEVALLYLRLPWDYLRISMWTFLSVWRRRHLIFCVSKWHKRSQGSAKRKENSEPKYVFSSCLCLSWNVPGSDTLQIKKRLYLFRRKIQWINFHVAAFIMTYWFITLFIADRSHPSHLRILILFMVKIGWREWTFLTQIESRRRMKQRCGF